MQTIGSMAIPGVAANFELTPNSDGISGWFPLFL
jgi:hypothetical protein